MLFNTVHYFVFLLIVLTIYYLIPDRVRYIWLLAASYYFYMQWNPRYLALIFFSTAITYAGALAVDGFKSRNEKGKMKACLSVCIILNLGVLAYFKYFNFLIETLNRILSAAGLSNISFMRDIILPVGISFFTLQALGYLIDVYRGDIVPEKNFFRYALFVSFFPQLVAGPIERSKNLLTQLKERHSLEYENLVRGGICILYGLFLKTVIADNASVIVDAVYGDPEKYGGFYIIIATILFSVQIYCDFYGYSIIAKGSARLFGIRLMDNFNAPYFSKGPGEFWNRWHISLSSWLRDYIYIPLGGGRKGSVKKERNKMIVFAVSGLWHGASWSYVLWGLLNGLYCVTEDAVQKVKKKFGIKNKDRFSRRLFSTAATFLIISFAWMFFRAGGIGKAFDMIIAMVTGLDWRFFFDNSLPEMGLGSTALRALQYSILILFGVDYLKYKDRDVMELLLKQGLWFKILLVTALFMTVLIFGRYGQSYETQQFIYFQF